MQVVNIERVYVTRTLITVAYEQAGRDLDNSRSQR